MIGSVPISTITDAPDIAIASTSWTPEEYVETILFSNLRKWSRFGTVLGGLDTGAFILAEAGLLDGHQATVHFEHVDTFRELYPDVDLVEAPFVIDRDRIFSGGAGAALELGVQVVAVRKNLSFSLAVARYLYQDRRPQTSLDQRLTHAGLNDGSIPTGIAKAIAIMCDNLTAILPVAQIAGDIGISQRKLERLFQAHYKKSPKRFYDDLRLDRARGLLTQTHMPIWEVAVACGYLSAEHFSRAYKNRFKTSPRHDQILGRTPFELRGS